VYVTNAGTNTVSVIDPTTNGIKATIPVGVLDWDAAVDAAGDALYVTDPVDGTVVVIDISTLPDAPTGLATTPGGGQVSLSWTAPTDTGRKPVTGYAITTTAAGATSSTVTQVTSSPAVVTGLTAGTSYSFAVTAQTANGAGVPSTTVTATPAAVPPTTGTSLTINRLGGVDRDATAIKTSAAEYPDAGTARAVVLARDDEYADALAAGPLAAHVDGPLLLTPPTTLAPATLAEITRVLTPAAAATVYLIGGDQALSPRVETAIKNAGFHPVRIDGAARADTAIAVARQLGDPGVVFEVTGHDFADGLAVAPVAIRDDAAILLTDGDSQGLATAAYLATHPSDVRYAVGGPATKADPNATPLAGTDRYATAAAVATHFFSSPDAAVVATGTAFPDALSGGVLAGRLNTPLLLAAPAAPLPDALAAYLRDHGSGIATIDVSGGTSAIDDSVLIALHDALGR
jgi:YVTN family beta-propeller protein